MYGYHVKGLLPPHKHVSLLFRLFPVLPPSFPPFAGRGTAGEAAGREDAKSSHDPRPSPSSLSALYLIDTCSLVNPGLPPGIAPHGSVANVHTHTHTHTVVTSHSRYRQHFPTYSHTNCTSAVQFFVVNLFREKSHPPNGLFEDI